MSTSPKHIKSIPVPVADIPRSGDELAKYLEEVLTEAYSLITTVVSPPKEPWSLHFNKNTKYGDVEVTSRNIEIEQGTEYWFARRNVVEEKEGVDGFTWDDFKDNLLHNHSENEVEYGPSVRRVDKIKIDWNLESISVPGWDIVAVAPYAIHHHLPWPLHPRVFPILLILVYAAGKKEFLVISLPIAIAADTEGINTATNEAVTIIGSKTTVGQYVSVERVAFLEAAENLKSTGLEWTMATASDASGNIPMALQRRVIGTSVLKDVEAFMDFVQKKKSTTTS